MKKLIIFFLCFKSAVSYGQEHHISSAPQKVPVRTVSRSNNLARRSSASTAVSSAPATPLSSSPSDRQVSFSALAIHSSNSEPSSPRPPAYTAPTPLNALIKDQDRAAVASERQAAALERIATTLELLARQNERIIMQSDASGKVLQSMSKSVEALVVAHAALHDDEAHPTDVGMKSILYLMAQREKIINSRSSNHH